MACQPTILRTFIDDFEMQVTHVIRGSEYIASTPKYLSLYEALKIDHHLAHVPHIMAPSGNKNPGKRDSEKRNWISTEGILPEVMPNFSAQLGWNDGYGTGNSRKAELIEVLTWSSPKIWRAIWRTTTWLNGQWIRSLSLDDLYSRCQSFWVAKPKRRWIV